MHPTGPQTSPGLKVRRAWGPGAGMQPLRTGEQGSEAEGSAGLGPKRPGLQVPATASLWMRTALGRACPRVRSHCCGCSETDTGHPQLGPGWAVGSASHGQRRACSVLKQRCDSPTAMHLASSRGSQSISSSDAFV